MSSSFHEELMTANVKEDAQKIVPALATDNRRLEVGKIKKIFAGLDKDFELSTDEDVYFALTNMKRADLLAAFRDCVQSIGETCNFRELNKLNPPRILALFFHVFAVTPKATLSTHADTNTDTAPFDDELFDEIFPNFTGTTDIELSAVAKFLPTQFRNVKSSDELEQILSNESIPQGTIVREFVKQVLETAGIEFDRQKLNSITSRKDYLPLFFRALNFKEPPQTQLVNTPQEILHLTFAQVQAIFDAAKKVPVDEADFDISDTLKIFKKNSVTVKDKLYLIVPEDRQIFYGLTAIVTPDGQIAAVGRIEDNVVEERGAQKFPHMIFDWENIDSEKFVNRKHFKAVLVPLAERNFFMRPMSQVMAKSFSGELWTLEFDVVFRSLEVTDIPLCIDFGTSNTTAGRFNAQNGTPEQVTFRDVTKDEVVLSEVLPTIVYVDSCIDGNITFKHGYEAKHKIIEAGYNTKTTVFYEIKRWINSLDKVEEVTDGNETAYVTRRDILADYLLFVIKAAEEQFSVKFKNLHMTSPVKLKKKFLDEMAAIFKPKGYVVDKDSLDEGLATVYHYIAGKIKNTNDTSGKILILDCGGGTTDLASCEYSVTKGNDWANVTLTPNFESGDSNFGGNNITYRILQILKMKIAANLERNENLPMHDLIPDEEDDILSQIDFDIANRDKIYAAFEREYQRAEDLIPTNFAKSSMRQEKRMITRNFHYLWQLAEAIKIEFFKSNLVNVDFGFEKDKKIFVRSPEEYFLSVQHDGKLQPKTDPMDGVEITIREIGRILLPDLYALLKTLLAHYTDNELLQYKYQLSGQSCKINKFRDLFKEFIPGKHMRRPHDRGKVRTVRSVDSINLKKCCILGSIEYVYDVKFRGKYTVNITTKKNRRIYDVKILLDKDETLLFGRGETLSIKKFPAQESITVEFLVRGENNRVERKFSFHSDDGDSEYRSIDELLDIMAEESTYSRDVLKREIGRQLQKIDLQAGQSILCFTALDSTAGYGFNIYQIWAEERNGEIIFRIPKTRHFEPYEDEKLQTFFDGNK